KQLTVAAIVLTALFASAVRLPATVCAVASSPIGEACHQGCCANKKCCADSQKNHSLPAQPLLKTSGNHEVIAIVAPVLRASIVSIRSFDVSESPSSSGTFSSAPRPALLCTFLI